MKEYRSSVIIAASLSETWAVLADVENWPSWTVSMRRVVKQEPEPLTHGSTIQVWQPGLPPRTWTVDEFTPLEAFSWGSSDAGVTLWGDHRLTPVEGGTRADLVLRQSGPLSAIAGLVYGRLTRRHLNAETEGLKRRSEGAIPSL